MKSCKSGPTQKAACGAVAKAIIQWRNTNEVVGRNVSPEPLRMSVDTLHYCCDVAPVVGDRLFILHLDCRSSMSLNAAGKEFMKSLIHHTARIGDLRDAAVGILRTPKTSHGDRKAVLEELSGDPVFSLEEILSMTEETYAIWELILRERRSGSESVAEA